MVIWNAYGQPCRVIVGSEVKNQENDFYFVGAGLEFSNEGMTYQFIDSLGKEI